MEKHDWTVTVSQQEQLYHAQCVSKQGETLTTELYETFEKALEAGHFIVERYCEQINGVKRRVQLDKDWLLNFYSTNDVSACYLDLRTGEMIDSYFVDEENEEIEYDDLEFSDFYLSIPSFSEGYQDMQAFFDSLENPILKTMAEETFYAKRKGGFKRIKNNPEIGFLWYGFEYEQQERRFYEWLDSENLELAEDEQKKSIREKVKEELISNIPELSEQLDQLGLEESNKQKLIQKLQESFNLDDSQTEDKEKCYYKCIAIAWKYIGENEGKYSIHLFQAVQLDNYQSLYWWHEQSFNDSPFAYF